jgi:hypothetical protein
MEEEIAALTQQNKDLKEQVKKFQTHPPTTPQKVNTENQAVGFSQEDAAKFKADVCNSIASEVKRFEAMIAANA